mmetsp:Transcript_57855/g.163313  ORF Transcript_57855/g.163313 Transcript_57855/m.163313 type:complete len:219 (-) Transcript_57855:113-769(-)
MLNNMYYQHLYLNQCFADFASALRLCMLSQSDQRRRRLSREARALVKEDLHHHRAGQELLDVRRRAGPLGERDAIPVRVLQERRQDVEEARERVERVTQERVQLGRRVALAVHGPRRQDLQSQGRLHLHLHVVRRSPALELVHPALPGRVDVARTQAVLVRQTLDLRPRFDPHLHGRERAGAEVELDVPRHLRPTELHQLIPLAPRISDQPAQQPLGI